MCRSTAPGIAKRVNFDSTLETSCTAPKIAPTMPVMMISAPIAYHMALGLSTAARFRRAQRTRHAGEDRMRAGRHVGIDAAQCRLRESDVERPRGALRVRHEREHVAAFVADAGGPAHRPVGRRTGEAQHDASVLFEIVEDRGISGEAPLAVRERHAQRGSWG